MHPIRTTLRALAVCAALAAAPLAHAVGYASATLSDMRIVLTDLDPDDGITPSFTILTEGYDTTGYFMTSAGTYQNESELEIDWHLLLGTSGDALDSAASQYGVTASGRSEGGMLAAQGTIDARAVSGAPLNYSTGSSLFWGATPNDPSGFYEPMRSQASNSPPARSFVIATLTPNTRLEITARADVVADADAACTGCVQDHRAVAGLSLSNYYFDGDGHLNLSDAASDRIEAYASSDTTFGANFSSADGRDLVLSLDNVGDEETPAATQTLYLGASVGAFGHATAAPEPATTALVGLGLGAAGWTARRRKAQG